MKAHPALPNQSLLSSLTQAQKEVVTSPLPLMVLAGAGSGKTRVLVSRIQDMVHNKGIPAERILALTFSNKATEEMKSRLGKSFPKQKPWISTFHSLGARFLEKYIHLLGFRPNFNIVSDYDQQGLLRNLLEEADETLQNLPPRQVVYTLQNMKSNLSSSHLPEWQDLLALYNKTLKELNLVDFEDILRFSLKIFQQHPEEAQNFSRKFSCVLVDEYQDTNPIQYALLRELVKGHQKLFVVGDDDQSIYAFRGANPNNLKQFTKDFPQAKVLSLEENYRSTRTILSAANHVIAPNPNRFPKKLWSKNGEGEKLYWFLGEDQNQELEHVFNHLRQVKMKMGWKYHSFAFLVRSNHQAREVERALREGGIPYNWVGGTKFYDRQEIKDALSYLKVLYNPKDDLSLLRALSFPKRGLGLQTRSKLSQLAQEKGLSCYDILSQKNLPFSSRINHALENFHERLEYAKKCFATQNLSSAFSSLMASLDFYREVEKEKKTPKAKQNASGLIYELGFSLKRFCEQNPKAKLKDYMTYLALFQKEDNKDNLNRAWLLTVHKAKGMEFDMVFLVGCSDNNYPHSKAKISQVEEEEERRLFYVAMTRAKKRLVLSMSRTTTRYQKKITEIPSRFLKEIPQELFAQKISPAKGRETPSQNSKEARKNFMQTLRELKTPPSRP